MHEFVGDAEPWAWAGRLADGSLFDWLRGPVASARGCSRPVQLAGGSVANDARTGQIVEVFDTADLPGGVLYKPCGTRLASLCESCAHTYRYDTYQLIKAGLSGGKGVPESVASHPAIFPTLTAPSFGRVHSHSVDKRTGKIRPCRARRDRPVCPHGRPAWCAQRHGAEERCVGTPLCLDCYDHDHQVIWNAFVPKLWSRTMDRLARLLAKLAKAHGVSVKLRFAKVAEFQARGALHLHALIRLDGYDPDCPAVLFAPPPCITAGMLADLLRQAVAETAILTPPHPDRLGPGAGTVDGSGEPMIPAQRGQTARRLGPEGESGSSRGPTGPSGADSRGWPIVWGAQVDVRIVREGIAEDELTERHVAGYLAKYATKSTETMGTTVPALSAGIVAIYADPATHLGRLVGAAWRLGRPEVGDAFGRLRPKAHMLGFAGHFSTKSRAYSTTLGKLRAARRPASRSGVRVITPDAYDRGEHLDHDPDDDTTTLVLASRWAYVGSGWNTAPDAELARASAAAARARRTTAKS